MCFCIVCCGGRTRVVRSHECLCYCRSGMTVAILFRTTAQTLLIYLALRPFVGPPARRHQVRQDPQLRPGGQPLAGVGLPRHRHRGRHPAQGLLNRPLPLSLSAGWRDLPGSWGACPVRATRAAGPLPPRRGCYSRPAPWVSRLCGRGGRCVCLRSFAVEAALR
jgi:hypothetical protein